MNKKKHILVVSQYFYPETFRINDICLEWRKQGYKITVLTGIPNYPQGKFYEGYGYTKKRFDYWNGIRIIRIPLVPRGKNSLKLIINYLSFVASELIWKMCTKLKADYVFIYEVSPMTQALGGVWYAKKFNVPCYLYVQDLWPENVEIVTGIHNKFLIGLIDKMVDYIYTNCEKIFATSESFVDVISKRTRGDKVEYWPQYAEDFYKPITPVEVPDIPNDKSLKIIFTGNIGYAQGLDILPKAATIIKKRQKVLEERDIKFVIVGEGRYKQELLQEIRKKDLEGMFVIIERKPSEYIPQLLSVCDAAFLSFMDNLLFEKTIPAKLQSYMACGMPIIASATGETAKIIKTARCGYCCDIGDADSLVEQIFKFTNLNDSELIELGKNSREYYNKFFDKKKLMHQLDKYFQ